MNRKIIAPAIFAMVSALSYTAANAAERKGPPGGGKPPVEAFEACANKSAADSCSFSGSRGDVTGTCITPPRGEDELLCAPEGGRPTQ